MTSGAVLSERAFDASLSREGALPGIYSLVLVAFLVLSRWLVAPSYLYYFDSANFALALKEFNPALHQPQPPGYPLFVALARLIGLVLEDAQQVLLVAGLAGAIAAVLVLLYLGTAMFDRNSGILAAALLASDPVFWFGGVTNQVRIFLALGMAAVCLLGWRALSAGSHPRRLYALFAGIGIAAGFRPIETWLLLPLAFWIWWRAGRSLPRLARALAAMAATTLPWLSMTVWRVGGPASMLRLLEDYANSQFQGSSSLFGASNHAAAGMFMKAVVWTLLGTLVWIWAVPFVARRASREDFRLRAQFLALAFLPPFLFAAFVHVGDPDQALAGITVLSLVGGAVVSRFFHSADHSRVYLAAATLAIAHASDFYHPRLHLAEAASYGSVRNVDRRTTESIRAIEALRREGPVSIVHYGSPVSFRQIAYYFPEEYVSALPDRPGAPPLIFFRHRAVPAPADAAGWIGGGSRRLICLAPPSLPGSALPGWRRQGPLFVLETSSESEVRIGAHRLIWQRP